MISPAVLSLVHGTDRYLNTLNALSLIADQIELGSVRHILIKPNLVSEANQLSNTHPEAVRAVLEFIRERYPGRIDIAEGAALCPTMDSFERFGYTELAREYHANLVDLNSADTVSVTVYDRSLKPMHLRMARLVVESDFRISICPPKTHNVTNATLSLKNMVMGSLVSPASSMKYKPKHETGSPGRFQVLYSNYRNSLAFRGIFLLFPGSQRSDKMRMHQSIATMNLNIAILSTWVLPHLAVIDGFEGMEGTGPNNGSRVDWKIALAGTDPVAVDSQSTWLMGFEPESLAHIQYSHSLGLGEIDLAKIQVRGGVEPASLRRSFKRHPSSENQFQKSWVEDAPELARSLARTVTS